MTDAAGRSTRTVRVLEIGGSHVTAAAVRYSSHDAHRSTEVVTAEISERVDVSLDGSLDTQPLLDALTAPGWLLPPDLRDTPWVIAIPGPFDYLAGRGTFADVAKFAALAGIDLRAALCDRWDVPTRSISFLNDADAYGLGEWAFGEAGRVKRLVCITLGTGVGSAFIDDGVPSTGGDDVPPDASAHLIQLRGRPLEEAVSTRAIVAEHTQRTGHAMTVEGIAASARAGDHTALAVLSSAANSLGEALAPWLRRFDARSLVVGGSISKSWDLLQPALRAGLDTSPLPLRTDLAVRPSTLRDTAPLLGAAVWHARTRRPTFTSEPPTAPPMTKESS